MTKAELIDAISENSEISKKDIGVIVNKCFEEITNALSKKEKVQIVGFGTFEARVRKERKGRNPSTGKEITIPESVVPAFKAGKSLKESVAK